MNYDQATQLLAPDAPDDLTPAQGDVVRIDTEFGVYMGTVKRYCEATDRVTVNFYDDVLKQRRTLTFDGERVRVVLKAEAAAITAAAS